MCFTKRFANTNIIPLNELSNIDEFGLTVELTDAQLDALARQVGRGGYDGRFAYGDLFNQKCRVLGIDPDSQTDIISHAATLDAFCAHFWNERERVEMWAEVARQWPRAKRCAGLKVGLTMDHYLVVWGMDKQQAATLIEGTVISHLLRTKPWSLNRLQYERAVVMAKNSGVYPEWGRP